MNRSPEPKIGPQFHHVGLTVSDLDQALRFWESFLERAARWVGVLDRPYLGTNIGYPGVRIRAAFLDLPSGGQVELLQYLDIAARPADPASGNPGHVHVCLQTHHMDATFRAALEAGARPVNPDGPVDVDGGPNRGARASYLRIPPDSATLELFQAPAEPGGS